MIVYAVSFHHEKGVRTAIELHIFSTHELAWKHITTLPGGQWKTTAHEAGVYTTYENDTSLATVDHVVVDARRCRCGGLPSE